MATRHAETADFEAVCNLSGINCLAVGLHQNCTRSFVLVSQPVVQAALEFINYKFGPVNKSACVFVWTKDGSEDVLPDDEVDEDLMRFYRVMQFYEKRRT